MALGGVSKGSPHRLVAVGVPAGIALLAVLSTLATGGISGNYGALSPQLPLHSEAQGCSSFSWSDQNNTLSGNCAGAFMVDRPLVNSSTGNGWQAFDLGPVAEVNASGGIVAVGYPQSGSVTNTSTSREVNVTDIMEATVTNAICLNSTPYAPNCQFPEWIPADAPGENGPTYWAAGHQLLGNATIGITFHFATTGRNASDRIKFDVTVSGWPWVNSSDVLGLEVTAVAYHEPDRVYYTYNATNDTLNQVWDSNNTTLSSLAFGPTANATGSASPTVHVTDNVGLSVGPNPEVAFALLTFEGAGGYSNLSYDPWVLFGPQTAIAPPRGLGPGTLVGSLLTPPVLLAIGGVIVGGVLLGWYARRVRQRPMEEGLTSAT